MAYVISNVEAGGFMKNKTTSLLLISLVAPHVVKVILVKLY